MATVKLNKSNIDRLEYAGKAVDYFDSELKGFGLRVNMNSRSFFCQRDIAGRSVRVSIGRYGLFTPDQARKRAGELLQKMACGVNPNEERKSRAGRGLTLGQAFEQCLADKGGMKEASRDTYRARMKHLAGWMNRPIASISRRDVLDEHIRLKSSVGAMTADMVLTVFSIVHNHCSALDPDFPENPCVVLSRLKRWAPKRARTGCLTEGDIGPWYRGVMTSSSSLVAKDAYLLALFTGLRRAEVCGLLVENVALESKTFTVLDTKNREDHTLPMCEFVYGLLKRRVEAAGRSRYVFPGRAGAGHVSIDAERLRVISGLPYTIHDLRRTFDSICERLGVSYPVTQRLTNHKPKEQTEEYIQVDMGMMRGAMDRIGAYLVERFRGVI